MFRSRIFILRISITLAHFRIIGKSSRLLLLILFSCWKVPIYLFRLLIRLMLGILIEISIGYSIIILSSTSLFQILLILALLQLLRTLFHFKFRKKLRIRTTCWWNIMLFLVILSVSWFLIWRGHWVAIFFETWFSQFQTFCLLLGI